MRLALSALVLLAATACPPPPAPPPPDDGGGVDAGSLVDGCLVAPAPPDPPRLTDWTCPTGWLAQPAFDVDAGELALGIPTAPKLCAPPPLPLTCPLGTRPALGSADCQPLGDACPSGDFPAVPAGTNALYVKPGATGNGSSALQPFGTIAQAVAAATTGTTIVLSKGTFTEHVRLNRSGVTLLGACVEKTILQPPGPDSSQATVDLVAGATVKNVQVTGPRIGVWVSNNLNPATVQSVLVQGAELAGVFVSDLGKVSLTDVLIAGTLPDPADNTMGHGLQVRTRGGVTGSGVVVDGNRDVGVTIEDDGSTVDLSDVVVRGTESELASHLYGSGLEVRHQAKGTFTRLLVEKNRSVGVVAQHAGTALTLTDAVIQDQRSTEATRRFGTGVEASGGAAVTFSRVLVRRNFASGVVLGDSATTLNATDVAILETKPAELDRVNGVGLIMKGSAQATLSRAVVASNHVANFLVAEPGSHLSLVDARVRDALEEAASGKWGVGLIAMDPSTVSGTRVRVERSVDIGVWAQLSAQVTLDDVVVADTLPHPTFSMGEGLVAQSQGHLTVHRGVVERVHMAGVHGATEAVVVLSDFTAMDMLPTAAGEFGRGVSFDGKAVASITRGSFVRNREAAIHAAGQWTNVTLDTVSVEDTGTSISALKEGRGLSIENGATAQVACLSVERSHEVAVFAVGDSTSLTVSRLRVTDTGGVLDFGDGIAIRDGAIGTIEDFEVRRSASIGVAVANAKGTLTRGLIVDNPIGLYVGEHTVVTDGPAGAFTVHVGDDTVFAGNTTRVSTATVPLPSGLVAAPGRADF